MGMTDINFDTNRDKIFHLHQVILSLSLISGNSLIPTCIEYFYKIKKGVKEGTSQLLLFYYPSTF